MNETKLASVPPASLPPGRVLVVEDEELLCRAYVRTLAAAGFTAVPAYSAKQALEAQSATEFDVVVSDIGLPEQDGFQLLETMRARDPDLPFVLVTGNPSVESAARAVELAVLRYLVKPVESATLVELVAKAVRLHGIARAKREAAAVVGAGAQLMAERIELEAGLVRALRGLWMAYQPIVDCRSRELVAFEALVRTREPSVPHPGAFFSAAEQLGRVHEVGRAIRAAVAQTLRERPSPAEIFINLHSSDLLDETLYDADGPLAPHASRIVLEVTERAALANRADVPSSILRLRKLGYRIAIDDLGAGYSGLSYFAILTPDVVKLDITLVRDCHREPVKRKLIGSLTTLCREMGMRVVAEGVETTDERDVVLELGCDLLQGYLFARPGAPFPEVEWP
jgi:EAL domain-containing protein (putative c-di-GMP-specific phosphodiesterase class I)